MAMPRKATTTVSTKGQVILPKAIRDRRRWPAGTELVVEERPDGVLLRQARRFPPSDPDKVFGMLRSEVKPMTLEEIDAALAEDTRRRYARD